MQSASTPRTRRVTTARAACPPCGESNPDQAACAARGDRSGGGLADGLLGRAARAGLRFLAVRLRTQAPAHLAGAEAEILLFGVLGWGILQADDLIEQRTAIDAGFALGGPALAVIHTGVAEATPVGIILDNRGTSAPCSRHSTPRFSPLQRRRSARAAAEAVSFRRSPCLGGRILLYLLGALG